MSVLKCLPLVAAISVSFPVLAMAEAITLEEIVVTAQKRAANMQDVPVAVQSVSGDDIVTAGVTDFTQIQRVAPGVVVNDTHGQVLPFIRGIGSASAGNGVYSSVAIYVDGVYNARITGGAFELANIESVQVLKGPQGALYGRNATGGALVVTTKTPTPGDEVSGKVSATVGDYGHRALSAYVEGDLGDTVAGSLSALTRERDGYVDNLTEGQDDLGSRDAQSVASKLVFEPSGTARFILGLSYNTAEDSDAVANEQLAQTPLAAFAGLSGGQAFIAGILQSAGLSPATAGAAAAGARFAGMGQAYGIGSNSSFENGVLQGDVSNGGNFVYTEESKAFLKATVAMDAFELVSITSVAQSDYEASASQSGEQPSSGTAGTPLSGTAFGFAANYETDVFSQEVQLVSTGGPLEWIAGLYYFTEEGDSQIGVDTFGISTLAADNEFEVNSVSAFGQVTFPLTEAMSLTLGGRYTDEEMHIHDFFAVGTPANTGDTSRDAEQLTGSLILDYQFEQAMVYGSVSTGFKSGALNTSAPFTDGVDPEEITSYELGFKSDLLDGRVRLNGALFCYDHGNVHLTLVDTEGSGTATLVDGTDSEVLGAELELTALLSANLTLKFAATALDAEYQSDVTLDSGSGLATQGKQLVGAADLAANLGLEYVLYLDEAELTLTPSVSYNSGVFYSPANTVGSGGVDDGAYTLVGFSVSYAHQSGWYASLFANNLTNTDYYSAGVDVNSVSLIGHAGDPRTIGATVGYAF